MLNYIWPILILCSFIYAIFSGNVQNLNSSIFESLEEVITLSMTLVGTMCLWWGLMEIVKNTSIMKKIIRMLRPVLNWLFPESKNKGRVSFLLRTSWVWEAAHWLGQPFQQHGLHKGRCRFCNAPVLSKSRGRVPGKPIRVLLTALLDSDDYFSA